MTSPNQEVTDLFPPWSINHWRQVDDSVRGGSSRSYLDSYKKHGSKTEGVYFHGLLDTKTLGGAGFASQKYDYNPVLDLSRSRFQGIRLHVDLAQRAATVIEKSETPDNPCVFTFTIVTTPAKKLPNGRTASRVVWEANFQITALRHYHKVLEIDLPFESFIPTYRGRPVDHLATKSVKAEQHGDHSLEFATERIYEIGLMCRSNFGKQEGEFGLNILKIEAIRVANQARNDNSWWSLMWKCLQRCRACLFL
ncbi:hypothetical protein FRC02_009750 [Tulasnella sp. 418]|nr:hypothetical protein FRC02_009750 [Tulasnella sp. 418]